MKYIYIGLGGSIGASLRYGLTMFIAQFWHSSFPLATLLINIIGAFILGLLSTIPLSINPEVKQVLTVGVIGSFTTLSTISADTVVLIEQGSGILGLAYIVLNMSLGLLVAYLGVVIGNRKGVRLANDRTN